MKYLMLFLIVSSLLQPFWASAETQTGRVLETVPISSQLTGDNNGSTILVGFQIFLKNISKSQSQTITIKLQDLKINYWGNASGCEPWHVFCPSNTLADGGSGTCTNTTSPPAAYACYKMDTCENAMPNAVRLPAPTCSRWCYNPIIAANTSSTKDCRMSKEEDSLIRVNTKQEVGGGKPARTEKFKVESSIQPLVEIVSSAFAPANTFSLSATEHFRKWTRSGLIKADFRSSLNLFDPQSENLSHIIVRDSLLAAGTSRRFKLFLHCGAFKEGLKCKFAPNYNDKYPGTISECKDGGNPKVDGPCLNRTGISVISSFKFEIQDDPGAVLGSVSTDIDFTPQEIIPVQTIPLNGGRPF